MNKLLVPSSALLWGLQLAFLSPALALILVNLYGATTAEVGWVLGIYNGSGFVASLVLPAYAGRKHDYLGPMLLCGAPTLLLAVVLALATTLPIATIALVVVGGPAGVGSSLLFAHLRHSGARPSDIVNTRAIVSVAWVAGPPLAIFIIGWFGNRAILLAIAAVAVLNIATTAIMISHVGGHRTRRGCCPRGARPALHRPAQRPLLLYRSDCERLPGWDRLLLRPGVRDRTHTADRPAAAERLVLRRHRRHRTAAVPGNDSPAWPVHYPVRCDGRWKQGLHLRVTVSSER
jgi:MFS family permease